MFRGIALRNVERRAFDLISASFARFEPISSWILEGFGEVKLPYTSEARPDRLYRFSARVRVPEASGGGLRWFLKIVASGNGRLVVDGSSAGGYDEAHTYYPITSGEHLVELLLSPRSMFGYHRWTLAFKDAYIVEAYWDAIKLGLRILALVDLVEKLSFDDPLRRDLEKLLEAVAAELWVSPSIQQIALAMSFLYEGPVTLYFQRGDLRRPYSDYLYLSGVYGVGVLKGLLKEPEASYTPIERVVRVAERASRVLEDGLSELRERYGKGGVVYAMGHAHIDAAWLWPRSETIEKVLRTFSSVVSLAKEYSFTFVQSSAQYYEWVEERDEKLFKEVKRLVEEGRWIIVGGMWVESDTQLVDGESLARQFLYGQRYFLRKFGRLARIGWIPDSFGFSGNLPQLMAKSGIEVFVTHKVMWNDTNEFPYHAFTWRGIDGTEIPVQVLITSYSEPMTPSSVYRYWRLYRQKSVAPFTIYSYGFGDGGGGPTREMLEYLELNSSLPGLPEVKSLCEDEYLERLREAPRSLPLWSGELYVEIHRGTYTTNVAVKSAMAEAEKSLFVAEALASIASIVSSYRVDKERLDRLWKLTLFNQFHDIIPGSSIKEVYDNAMEDLKTVIEESRRVVEEAVKSLVVGGVGRSLVVASAIPWSFRAVVEAPRGLGVPANVECQEHGDRIYIYVEAPPMGVRGLLLASSQCRAEGGVEVVEGVGGVELRNSLVSIVVDDSGDIASLRLADGLEILREPAKLMAHMDKPGIFDAWDITEEFLHQGVELKLLEKPRVAVKGPLVSCVEVSKGFEGSKVIQQICLYKNSPVVEVKARLAWRNKGVLLKHWFRTTVNAVKAWYDIPFGVVERPTIVESSWDRAKFEVPAVRWADISDGEKGLAIIAPSRHGYSARDGDIGLSLIRSPMFLNPWSDVGDFEVTYYLYPHRGDYHQAEVPRVAREVVYKPLALVVEGFVRNVPTLQVEPQRVILTTLKPSEDGRGYVVRLYNPYKEPVAVSIRLGFKARRVVETDIIELKEGAEVARDMAAFNLEFKPFEIKTVLVEV